MPHRNNLFITLLLIIYINAILIPKLVYADIEDVYDNTLKSGFNWHQYAKDAELENTEDQKANIIKFDSFNPDDMSSSLLRYFHSYAVSSALYNAARNKDLKSSFTCQERYDIDIGKVTIHIPMEFNINANYPHKGVWKHQYKLNRCNKERVYNVYGMASPKGEPHFISAPMGYTPLDLREVSQVMADIFKAVAEHYQKMQFCDVDTCLKSIIVTDSVSQIQDFIETSALKTNISDSAKNQLRPANWSEIWTIYACNRESQFALDFSYDTTNLVTFKITN